jgi:hypothetical protein
MDIIFLIYIPIAACVAIVVFVFLGIKFYQWHKEQEIELTHEGMIYGLIKIIKGCNNYYQTHKKGDSDWVIHKEYSSGLYKIFNANIGAFFEFSPDKPYIKFADNKYFNYKTPIDKQRLMIFISDSDASEIRKLIHEAESVYNDRQLNKNTREMESRLKKALARI